MRRTFLIAGLALLCCALGRESARAQFYQQRSSAPPASPPSVNHIGVPGAQPSSSLTQLVPQPPVMRRSVTSTTRQVRPPAGVVQARPTQQAPSNGSFHGHHHHGGGSGISFFSLGGGFPVFWTGPFVPVYAPMVPIFSPWPQSFSGVVADTPPQQIAEPAPQDPVDAPIEKGKPKPTNAEQKAKAGRSIAFGDAHFGKQKYLAASERYKMAAQMAPDMGEPYFRQAHAAIAMGQYDVAARAFRRGLKIRSDWSASPFRLDQLYGADVQTKNHHIEALASAVEKNPMDATLIMMLGLELYFDGRRDKAELCFERVVQLGGNDDRLLDDFLARPAPADADPKDKNAAGKIPLKNGKIVF